ncbi:hypothetical protein AYI68_g3888 [Smittium mucronatum]|uniref:Uncharacterized protein n=1 Tax=Smittium mucronatum TaxID=133383 RepID=A0A1R0GYP1_9FUNG|nr:hypothetical protein AYI68_g3888 [Smittium mucronatum]
MFLRGLSVIEKVAFVVSNIFASDRSPVLVEIKQHYFSLGVELPPWVDVPPPDPLFEDELPYSEQDLTSSSESQSPHGSDSTSQLTDNSDNSLELYSIANSKAPLRLSTSDPQLHPCELVIVPPSPTFKSEYTTEPPLLHNKSDPSLYIDPSGDKNSNILSSTRKSSFGFKKKFKLFG